MYEKVMKAKNRGAIFVVTAILLPVFLVCTGLAFDFGFLYVEKNKLQDVADAAALAGAANMSSESRYYGGQGTALDATNMPVGKAIIDYVKINDSEFNINSLAIANVKYKGTYRSQSTTGWNDPTSNVATYDDSGDVLVKLMDYNCWVVPNEENKSDSGPKFGDSLHVKVEYAVSGRLNSYNFDAVDENGAPLTGDDRVRVRLSKRVPLPFLGAFSDKYAKGAVITVVAAAKGKVTETTSALSFTGPIIDGTLSIPSGTGKIFKTVNATDKVKVRVKANSTSLNLSRLPAGLYLDSQDAPADKDSLTDLSSSKGKFFIFDTDTQISQWDTAYILTNIVNETDYGITNVETALAQSGYADNTTNRALIETSITAKQTLINDCTNTLSAINAYVANPIKKVALDVDTPVVPSTYNSSTDDIYFDFTTKNNKKINDQIYLKYDDYLYVLEDYNLAYLKDIPFIYLKVPDNSAVVINTNKVHFGTILTNGTLFLQGKENYFDGVIYTSSYGMYLGGTDNYFFTNEKDSPFSIVGNTTARSGLYCPNGTIYFGQGRTINYSNDYKNGSHTTNYGLVFTYDNTSPHVYTTSKNGDIEEIYERWYITYKYGDVEEKWYYHYDKSDSNDQYHGVGYFIRPNGDHYKYKGLQSTNQFHFRNESGDKWVYDGRTKKWSTDNYNTDENDKLVMSAMNMTYDNVADISSYSAYFGKNQGESGTVVTQASGLTLVE